MIIKVQFLDREYETTIDDCDEDLFLKDDWKVTSNRYVYRNIYDDDFGTCSVLSLHTAILERKLKRKILPGMMTDHIDRNTLNNCRHNLREVNRSLNGRNSKLHKNNTSGFRGVNKHYQRWQAQIKINGVRTYLGTYDTPEEASKIVEERHIKEDIFDG